MMLIDSKTRQDWYWPVDSREDLAGGVERKPEVVEGCRTDADNRESLLDAVRAVEGEDGGIADGLERMFHGGGGAGAEEFARAVCLALSGGPGVGGGIAEEWRKEREAARQRAEEEECRRPQEEERRRRKEERRQAEEKRQRREEEERMRKEEETCWRNAWSATVADGVGAVVDKEMCVGCGACEAECPVQAIEIVDGKAVVKADECVECGACTATCPVEAIRLS